ncbi:MAG: hypothetical protein HY746_04115 [Elusimicrobia bacterium]|nr:hypothetical protein [Elusimicrobiota bacterium]
MAKSAVFLLAAALAANVYAAEITLNETDFLREAVFVSESIADTSAGTAALRPDQRASGSSSAGGFVPLPQVSDSQNDLMDLLRDTNPHIRKAAVIASKQYILNSSPRDRIIDILEDTRELAEIRIEAARTLCYATGYSDVKDALGDLIKYRANEPKELKAMTYKALWTAANGHSQIRDLLVDRVKYSEKDPELRRAAIWALFDASMNYNVRDLFVDMLKYNREDDATRIETIKSLYLAMGHYEAKNLMLDIVKDTRQDKQIRITALKALSGARGDSNVERFIEDTIRYERDEDLRVTAIEITHNNVIKIREFFHLGYKLENGGYINPIEKE